MKMRWLGQASFHIVTDDGVSIRTDPYDSSLGFELSSLPADIVTESVTISRTRTKTEVETLYTYTTRYVTRSSKVTVTDTLTKTGKTMSTMLTMTGIVTVTTCSPTVTETRTISTMLAQRLSAISPLVVLSIITLNILYRRGHPHKKGVS